MENTPEAAGAAPATQPEATPNTNSAPAAPDMHGFTSEELAEMRKFYDSRGGFEKVKSMLSNPQNYSEPVQKPNLDATYAMKKEEGMMKAPQPEQPKYEAPFGSITKDEYITREYFRSLSQDPRFATISKEIESGAVLKDMARLGIKAINQDGSINNGMVREFLKLKADTVVAKQTSSMPEASAAPTVEYSPYDEKTMDMKQAMAILQQDSALRSRGQAGHPHTKEAEDFMRNLLNKGRK